MELSELKKLVRRGEGLHLEFKLKATHPEKIVREMVAFANSEGGTLLVGVADDRSILGLKYPKEDEYVLQKAIEKYCSPPIKYLKEKIQLDNEREVLAFFVDKSDETPHYFIENQTLNLKKAYIRVEDKCLQASKEMREVLKGRKKENNIRFQFGSKEKILMEYLANYQKITVEEFSKVANIPLKIASRTLVLLVLGKVLDIAPLEGKDCFRVLEELSD
jgi:predicted HTH transcriptional regulator